MNRSVRYPGAGGLLALALVAALGACTVAYEDEEGGTSLRLGSAGSEEPLRFAVARYQHETCTFCPGGDTEVDDWLRASEPLSGEALLSGGGYVGGFVKRAREFGDVELVPLTSPVGVYGGSSRSWNTKETFDHFLNIMLAELEEQLPVDGVYLALHGAMAVRDVPRPEAEIARRFREVVGPGVPIAGAFDLHGNEDAEFLEHADFSFVTKRFPHYDAYIQGERAARALRLAALGEYRSTTATRKPGVITATVLQWTGQSPAMDIMERARRWEARENDAYVSVFYGYPWSDVPDVGATVQVMTNDDQELADRIADDMDDFIWRVREDFAVGGYPGPEEAARVVATAIARGETPVAVGDYSDRPGDATHILSAFEAAGIGNVLYGTITSPATLEALAAANAQPGDPSTWKSAASRRPAAHLGASSARWSTSARASATTGSPRFRSATATSSSSRLPTRRCSTRTPSATATSSPTTTTFSWSSHACTSAAASTKPATRAQLSSSMHRSPSSGRPSWTRYRMSMWI